MIDSIKNHFSTVLESEIVKVNPVSGGSISSAFKVSTSSEDYFLKINSGCTSKQMFDAEIEGLDAISKTSTINTPRIIHQGEFNQNQYLLLEFIEPKAPDSKDFENLGNKLAELHKHRSDVFGWKKENFIGSLPQSNVEHENWAQFYYYRRLLSQFNLAQEKGALKIADVPSENKALNILEEILGNPKPVLLHGDLWGGNFLISTDGIPYLIDPAVYYGHGEVDIAMSKLFGGFGETFYSAYFNAVPSDSQLSARIEIYQLYYLLVHLNLFGSSYYSSVKSILQRYF